MIDNKNNTNEYKKELKKKGAGADARLQLLFLLVHNKAQRGIAGAAAASILVPDMIVIVRSSYHHACIGLGGEERKNFLFSNY